MKNRKLILVAVSTLLMVSSVVGCGKKTEKASAVVKITPTAVPTVTPGALVDMEQNAASEEDQYKNIIGEKTSDSISIVLVNQLRDEIVDFYVRPAAEEGEYGGSWGKELIQDKFTLKNTEKALYYFEASTDDEGKKVQKYDLRVSFGDEDKDEYFFRGLPLTTMKELRLCLSGTGEDAIPYARYTTDNKRFYSTLEEVKRRLGMEEDVPTPIPPEATSTPVPTVNPVDNITNVPDQGAAEAAQYIGQPIDSLLAVLGNANSSAYEDEPETGRTGYYYYDTFTVSTAVDDDGNEVVAGVW